MAGLQPSSPKGVAHEKTTAAAAKEDAPGFSLLLLLPRWLLLSVAWFLPARDLLHIERCCRQMKQAGDAWDGLWRHRLISDFVRRYESLPATLNFSGVAPCFCHVTGGGCCKQPGGAPKEGSSTGGSRSAVNAGDWERSGVTLGSSGSASSQRQGEAKSLSGHPKAAHTLGLDPFSWRGLYSRVCMLLRNLKGGLAYRRVLPEVLRRPVDSTVQGGLCITLDCRRLLWCSGEKLQCIDMDLECVLWSSTVGEDMPQPPADALLEAPHPSLLGFPPQRGGPVAAASQRRATHPIPPALPYGPSLWNFLGEPLGPPNEWRSRCHVVASASHAFTFVEGRLCAFCMHSGLLVREFSLGLPPREAAAAASPMPIDICHRNSQFVFISKLGASFFDSETLVPLFRLQHMDTIQLLLHQQHHQLQGMAHWGAGVVGGRSSHADDSFDFCWAGAACGGRPLHRRTSDQQGHHQQLQQPADAAAADLSPNIRAGSCGCFCHLNGAERNNNDCGFRGCWDGWSSSRCISSSNDCNSRGWFASSRCSDPEMQCSMRCCRLRCRHIITWHSGISRNLLVWSATAASTAAAAAVAPRGAPAGSSSTLIYKLKGHERPVVRVRQLTDWRDMHEYFLASLDAGGTVRVWHSAAFPPRETAAAAAAAAAARAPRSESATTASWAAQRQQEQQGNPNTTETERGLSIMGLLMQRETDYREGRDGVGCIAIIPPMGAYWIHRISLSSQGLLTLCKHRQAPPRGQHQPQQLLLLWALGPPSLSSMRANRQGATRGPSLPLDWGETDPHQFWDELLKVWRHVGRRADNGFSFRVWCILREREGAAARASSTQAPPATDTSAAPPPPPSRGPDTQNDSQSATAPAASALGRFGTGDIAVLAAAPATSETVVKRALTPAGSASAPSTAVADDGTAECAAAGPSAMLVDNVGAALSKFTSGEPSAEVERRRGNSNNPDGDSELPLQQQLQDEGPRGARAEAPVAAAPSYSRSGEEEATEELNPHAERSNNSTCSSSALCSHPHSSPLTRRDNRSSRSTATTATSRIDGDNTSSTDSSSSTNTITTRRNVGTASNADTLNSSMTSNISSTAVSSSNSSSRKGSTRSGTRTRTLEVRGAYLLPGTTFFAECSAKGLISILCGEEEVMDEGDPSRFPPPLPRNNPFRRSLADWLVFDLERIEREGGGRPDEVDASTEEKDEAATAAIAVELYDEMALAQRRANRCWWYASPPAARDYTNLPLHAFIEPAATQWRLEQQQRAAEAQKKKEAIKRHRCVVLQWVERQRRRRYRAAATAAAAAAGSVRIPEGAGAAGRPAASFTSSQPQFNISSLNNSNSSSNSGAPNSNRDDRSSITFLADGDQNAEAFSRGGGGMYPWWPARVKPQELNPLSSVVWLREKGNAWALIDWKAVQIDAKGTLVILDFAHPDASPICPLVFM